MKDHRNTLFTKFSLSLLVLIALSSFGHAQNLTGPTSVEPGNIETYTYNDGTSYAYDNWDIVGGGSLGSSSTGTTYTVTVAWQASVGSGSVTFRNRTSIKETLIVTREYGTTPPTLVTDLNYVHNITPRIATTSTGTLGSTDKIEAITYFDGLGRARQSIGIRAGGNSEDIITHIEYDEFGRNVKEYLPYSSSTDIGTYRVDALNATNTYYDGTDYDDDFLGMTTADINPYSEKEFDNSPLNRVMKQAAPGKDWKLGNDHEIEMEYLTNTSSTEVRLYTVSLTKYESNTAITYSPSLISNNEYYPPNELYKTVTKDENHDGTSSKLHTTEEFKDKQGRVILKRTYALVNSIEEKHDTYYVYDDYGNLSFVLPPKSESHIDKPNSTEVSELCYQYKYDDRNRLVEKKIPGKGWEYIVYNKLDQPVMTQDTEMKNDDKWLVTKYDVFGRVAYTAMKNTPGTRPYFQNLVNTHATATQHEEKVYPGTGYLNTHYTSNAIPLTLDEVLTINYYDDYEFDRDGGTSETAYGVTPITNAKGLATGSKVRVLGTNYWITTVSYYDSKARPIYVYSKNGYLSTTDKVKNDLTFDGRATETMTVHVKNGFPTTTITIYDKYTYDDANRLTEHRQKVNSAALDEVIASNTYDDLGQLVSKGVGGKQNASRLQDVHYGYNVRGWLKSINGDPNGSLGNNLFAFKIEYTDPILSSGVGLFNGNIAEIDWKTKSDNTLFRYTYYYDALNRITKADFAGGGYWSRYQLNNVSYDKNGNILNLKRKGHIVAQPDRNISTDFGTMDDLSYTYDSTSNRLVKVGDSADASQGFKDGNNVGDDYTYDANGNMTSDANKDISSIDYNHLNLPTRVGFYSDHVDIDYIYDATGTKLKKIVGSTGTTTEYAGNFIYENGVFKMFSHPEGYVEKVSSGKSTTYEYAYQYKDHLGNIRLTYADSDKDGEVDIVLNGVDEDGDGDMLNEIIEENNYYPFGLEHKGYNNVVNGTEHPYKYNGKELNEELGLDWYDFGVRNYDPALGRWFNIDPMAEVMPDQSTYVYALNSPLFFIDPDGALPWPVHIRSFINPSSVAGGKFKGDGRGPSTQSSPEATSRVRTTFVVDPAKGSVSNPVSQSDPTRFNGISNPTNTGPLLRPIEKTAEPSSSITNVETSKNSVSLDFEHSGKDPITPGIITPDLDVQANLSITEDLDAGILNVTGEFTGDAFPSTEAFITDQSGEGRLLLGAHKEQGGLGNLFGENKRPTFSVNMQVNIDSSGNFTGVTQGDKTYTVSEWNQHVKDSFNN